MQVGQAIRFADISCHKKGLGRWDPSQDACVKLPAARCYESVTFAFCAYSHL